MQIEDGVMPAVEVPHGSPEETTDRNWLTNTTIVWRQRKLLGRTTAAAFVLGLAISLLIPKTYESTALIMPPENSGSGGAILAALTGRVLGNDTLGGIAASLLGGHNTGALFVDLLRSGTVTGHLIDRFQLQSVYRKRYRVDTAKYLLRHTVILQDKKSGVITLTVKDHDPKRARDLAQAYLDELNLIVNRTSTSSAHRERVFIEQRLAGVKSDLDRAQKGLSEFASTHATVDLREQTRATVESAAKLEGELIVTQGDFDSLRQIYGDGNVRVRAAQARIGNLKREIAKISGTSAELSTDPVTKVTADSGDALDTYPPLRQLPRLAVPYSDLYRNVRVQETVYELLTQQYEIARIQEARDIPVVNVIDSPGIPEKKSFPPRALFTLAFTLSISCSVCFLILGSHFWNSVNHRDPRRVLAAEIWTDIRSLRFRMKSEDTP